ncbi:MAG: hypothetical protein MJ252_03955 [archaeon]|nr:hypothetical protein [archaeon]
MISLYEEENKSGNPTEYIKAHLRSSNASDAMLLEENKKLKEEAKKLKKEIKDLQRKIDKLEKPSE